MKILEFGLSHFRECWACCAQLVISGINLWYPIRYIRNIYFGAVILPQCSYNNTSLPEVIAYHIWSLMWKPNKQWGKMVESASILSRSKFKSHVFFTYWPKLFGDKNYLVRVVGERVLCRWIVNYELIIYWLQMRKWRWKGNALPFNSKQCQGVSNLFWYVYTLLKSVVLVWAMEVCYKESMPLGNRGNGDLFIRYSFCKRYFYF